MICWEDLSMQLNLAKSPVENIVGGNVHYIITNEL